MHNNYHENLCPRCLVGQMKTWQELTDDEKILAEKMPLSAQYSSDERKRHLFCTRCWFEQTSQKADV
jgi:hypothetical protein